MKKLKIVQISPYEESVPPRRYGGAELIVSYITEELINRGHKVFLIASGDSITKAKLLPVCPKSIRTNLPIEDFSVKEIFKFIGIGKILKYLRDLNVDVIHNHVGWRMLPFEQLLKVPMITTIHGSLDIKFKQIIYDSFKKSYFVSISNNQREPLPQLNYIGTVYNGIDTDTFSFNEEPQNYLAFLGRMSPEKGPIEAIKIAKKAGFHLKMAAKVNVEDKEFFEKEVAPLIDGKQIKFLGEVSQKEKVSLLKNAKALLAPINWREPFGLFFIEPMACGTPVIAFRRGSVPEIIRNRLTGFICRPNCIDSMVKAVKKIYQMPRKEYKEMRYRCRKHVEDNFTIKKMVSNYERIYYQVLKENGKTKS